MYKTFLEISIKGRIAAIFFILGKAMFLATAISIVLGKTAVIISLSLYAFFIFGSIVFCMWDGLGKKKTYTELEKEIRELKLKLLRNAENS
jgi:hypothetical protein|tara:strand:+ start:564 stop:836 length:273 start_codon:yes stop_codon:yes gene_type:complete